MHLFYRFNSHITLIISYCFRYARFLTDMFSQIMVICRIQYHKRGDIVYEEKFPARLAQLRCAKGVSARDMSLSIGQNPGYINDIESRNALPSMSSFFFICEYLDITPHEFFDFESNDPHKLGELSDLLKQLDTTQLDTIITLVKGLLKK